MSQGGRDPWLLAHACGARQLCPGLLAHARAAGHFPLSSSLPGGQVCAVACLMSPVLRSDTSVPPSQNLVLWRNKSDPSGPASLGLSGVPADLEIHLLLFWPLADSGLFGVPLHSLLEADHRVLPSAQVPLLLQAVSYPQLGLT